MAKQEWQENELFDVLGMSTNTHNPGPQMARRILNAHTHEHPGKVSLRPGYGLKYPHPSASTLGNTTFMNFDMFYDRQADPEGTEITCEIVKGTVTALDNSGSPIVNDTLNGFFFFCRPYWKLTHWEDAWQWVNNTIITKITAAPDATYKSMIKVFGNSNHGLGDGSLIKWTIYNKNRSEFAKIITCKSDGDELRLNTTLYNSSSWTVDDVVIICKNWLDLDYQTTYYNLVNKEDIVFHRINNDLRIGFGGFNGRQGLMVGYRQSYLQLTSIVYTNMHADLLEDGVNEDFSEVNEIILEPAILDKGYFDESTFPNPFGSGDTSNDYGIDLSTQSGVLAATTYTFRLAGVIDGFQEQLIAQGSITVDGTKDILVQTWLRLATESRRLTRLKLYESNDNISFYKIYEWIIRKDTFGDPYLTLGMYGKINGLQASLEGGGEFHNDPNAAAITAEADSIGAWVNQHPWPMSLLQSMIQVYLQSLVGYLLPDDGTYLLACLNTANNTFGEIQINSPLLTPGLQNLEISLSLALDFDGHVRIQSNETGVPNPAGPDFKDFDITGGVWTALNFELMVSGSIAIRVIPWNLNWVPASQILAIDKMTVTNPDAGNLSLGAEMAAELNYLPTFNMVKGWDAVIIYKGRVYYLNPFVEKRYENYLLVSAISGDNAFMWDMASFDNFRELERHDGDNSLALVLLDTTEILIIKERTFEILQDDGQVGILREPIVGVSCATRNGVVDLGGIVIIPGIDDIYSFNTSGGVAALLEKTIRDIYQAIDNKELLFAIRDRYNSYRFRVYDEDNKTEFLLTKNGWIEESKFLFPVIYREDFHGKLNFMALDGNIYATLYELENIGYGRLYATKFGQRL